jgi:hypothetical protein
VSWTTIPLSIVVVGRHAHDQLFIGRLDPQGTSDPLIENLRHRREGALPELGTATTGAWRHPTTSAGIMACEESMIGAPWPPSRHP